VLVQQQLLAGHGCVWWGFIGRLAARALSHCLAAAKYMQYLAAAGQLQCLAATATLVWAAAAVVVLVVMVGVQCRCSPCCLLPIFHCQHLMLYCLRAA
jgi:hypothetical protein